MQVRHSAVLLVWTAALTALCGCNGVGGLVGTQIRVEAGQRTLEQQVLGSYERIGEEVYVLAGVRAIDPATGRPSPPPPMTQSEMRALSARRRMEFNRDDVLRFKREGYVGEGRDGFLAVFEERLADLEEAEPRRARLVRAIAEEENGDRRVVMQRIVDTTPELGGGEGLRTVGRILAARGRDEAEPGMRVQLPDGRWVVKGGGR
jgi:hypothetical protein